MVLMVELQTWVVVPEFQGKTTLRVVRTGSRSGQPISARVVSGMLSSIYPPAADNVGKICIIDDPNVSYKLSVLIMLLSQKHLKQTPDLLDIDSFDMVLLGLTFQCIWRVCRWMVLFLTCLRMWQRNFYPSQQDPVMSWMYPTRLVPKDCMSSSSAEQVEHAVVRFFTSSAIFSYFLSMYLCWSRMYCCGTVQIWHLSFLNDHVHGFGQPLQDEHLGLTKDMCLMVQLPRLQMDELRSRSDMYGRFSQDGGRQRSFDSRGSQGGNRGDRFGDRDRSNRFSFGGSDRGGR